MSLRRLGDLAVQRRNPLQQRAQQCVCKKTEIRPSWLLYCTAAKFFRVCANLRFWGWGAGEGAPFPCISTNPMLEFLQPDHLMSSFPLGYLRTFCPRKSKPFSTWGDDRLRGRKFQTSFLQKLLDEGFDFSFQ